MAIKMRARVNRGQLELPNALELPDGQEVVVIVETDIAIEEAEWQAIGMESLEATWNNPEDAIYDNWRSLCGVSHR